MEAINTNKTKDNSSFLLIAQVFSTGSTVRVHMVAPDKKR